MTLCLATSTTEENVERVSAVILVNLRVTIDEVAHHLRISQGSAHGPSDIDLGLVEFVRDGFQNNSQESTSATVRKPAKAYCTVAVTKMTLL
jgi:hypothetical protein